MGGEILESAFALVDTVLGISFAKQSLRSGLVHGVHVCEASRLPGNSAAVGDRPAGDDARQRGDVVLAVATVDPQRVQLEYFPGEVFVEPALISPAPGPGDRTQLL